MVRFETKLHNNAIKEWIPFYVDYRQLKKLLYQENTPATTPLQPFDTVFSSPRWRDINAAASGYRFTSVLDPTNAPLLNVGSSPGGKAGGEAGGGSNNSNNSNNSNDSDSPHNSMAIFPDATTAASLLLPSPGKSDDANAAETKRHDQHRPFSPYRQRAPPRGTKWQADAWDDLKQTVMGIHLYPLAAADRATTTTTTAAAAAMDDDDDDEHKNVYVDETGKILIIVFSTKYLYWDPLSFLHLCYHFFHFHHGLFFVLVLYEHNLQGHLSLAPTAASESMFRIRLLAELAKVDAFYNDMVDDLEGQLHVLAAQARTTEELGKSRRRMRLVTRQRSLSPSFGGKGKTTTGRESNKSSSTRSSTRSSDRSSLLDGTESKINLERKHLFSSSALDRDIESIRDMDSPSREALALASSKRAYVD